LNFALNVESFSDGADEPNHDSTETKQSKSGQILKSTIRNVAVTGCIRQSLIWSILRNEFLVSMKFGNYRGFAFVEYVTQQEAQKDLTALSSTHLYCDRESERRFQARSALAGSGTTTLVVKYAGPMDVARHVLGSEGGIKRLFKGLIPTGFCSLLHF
ncbi:hypothetical protein RYX36_025541, partial [Vicia faba]